MPILRHNSFMRSLDKMGAPLKGSKRSIFLNDKVDQAQAFSDPELLVSQPPEQYSDVNGYFPVCFLKTGVYRIEIHDRNGQLLSRASDIWVGEKARSAGLNKYPNYADLSEDQLLSYHEATGRVQVLAGQELDSEATQIKYRILPEGETEAVHLETQGGVKLREVGARFSSEAHFAETISAGEDYRAGDTVSAAGEVYRYLGDGNTDLPNLRGWTRLLRANGDLQDVRDKLSLMTVTQAVNLDAIPALVSGSSTYDSVAAGIAATANGASFFVPVGPGLQRYRNDSGAGTFLGWHGGVSFDDVAALKSETALFDEDLLLRTRREGFAYQVAPAAAKDHHLEVGANKLYVLPLDGAYHVDALGIAGTGDCPGLAALCTRAAASGMPVRFGAGGYTITPTIPNIALSRGETLRWQGTGDTKIHVTDNLRIEAEKVLDSILVADADRQATEIELSNTAGLEIGDLLHIDTDTPVESGWNYHKQCVRRVASVDGNTVLLDQPLDFFFTVAESTVVRGYGCASIHFSGLNFQVDAVRSLGLRHLCDSTVEHCKFVGPAAGWSATWSDGVATVSCDCITYEHVTFEKLRYGPQITTGSRFIQVKKCLAQQVRHLDANTWAQDILYEDIVGVSTDGIIQCHPCIRPVFRRVTDSVTQSGLGGVDMRGLGEVIEDCTVHHNNGGILGNTNAPLLRSDYEEMAGEFTRRYTRLTAPMTKIRAGKEGRFIIEQCDVGDIDESQYTLPHLEIAVDDLTRARAREEVDLRLVGSTSDNFAMTVMDQKRAKVPVMNQYRSRVSVTEIDGITQANPAQVTTLYQHRLRTGDQVSFADITGMTELNGTTGSVTVVDDFTLTLDGVDSTGFGAWSAGGTVTLSSDPVAITGITEGAQTRMSCAGHPFQDGDVLWVDGIKGMMELNGSYYIVAASDAAGFGLKTLEGDDVDSTVMSTYASDGKVTHQEIVTTVDASSKPECGIRDQLFLRSQIWTGNSNGQKYYRFPVKYRAFGSGGVDQLTRWGLLRVIATSNVGRSIAEHAYSYDAQAGTLRLLPNSSTTPNSNCVVEVLNAQPHYLKEVRAEGSPRWTIQTGGRHYFTFDIKVDVDRDARFLYDVVVEFDEQRHTNY